MRSLLVVLTALGALALAPGTAAPAAAAVPGPTGPADVHPEWGATAGHDATLRKGCRGYAYDYAITPPAGYWGLETFLVGPDGNQYGGGFLTTGADPLAGADTFRLCQRSTPIGTYTIRARLTVSDDFTGYQTGWLPDSTFTLEKPARKRHPHHHHQHHQHHGAHRPH